MGGIVAADTVINLTSEKPILPETTGQDLPSPSLHSLMFPYIQGVLAFDTPYLGISPGVVAHGAESHYNTATNALAQINNLWGTGKSTTATSASSTGLKALPAPPVDNAAAAVPAQSGWGKWGRVAMYAGAGAAALAATSAAAYVNRDNITQGLGWVSSHLEFVGCLARAEDLKRRVAHLVRASEELDFGFANLYTRLGQAAGSKNVPGVAGSVFGSQRTFCNLPSRMAAGTWKEAVNDKASDETIAHMSRFYISPPPFYCRVPMASNNAQVCLSRITTPGIMFS